jgi:hypothetical protein
MGSGLLCGSRRQAPRAITAMKIPPHEFEIADRYYHELDRLLGETPSAAEERERSSFWRLAEPFGRRFVIFGAGQLGRKVADTLRRHRIEPLAFASRDARSLCRSRSARR